MIPFPGSSEARKVGCTCPTEKRGYDVTRMDFDPIIEIRADCPIHVLSREEDIDA